MTGRLQVDPGLIQSNFGALERGILLRTVSLIAWANLRCCEDEY